MERTSQVRGTKSLVNKQKANRAKEVKTSLLFANQDYKGFPARSRRKIQTRGHLHGNLFCLGEEWPSIKDTIPWPTFWSGYEESTRSNPHTAQVRRDSLLASFLLASPPPKTLRGVKLAGSTLDAGSPRATLSPTGTVRRTATKSGADIMIRHLNALQAEGHRRRKTSKVPCSSIVLTKAEGW